MADHHIDSADIDYSKLAEYILKRYGLYIAGAPPINHKPGNDWWSDVYYPFPNYPDNRFRNPSEENLDIKDPGIPEPPITPTDKDYGKDFQIIPEDMKNLKHLRNPIVSFFPDDRYRFINKAVASYTGLTIQAVEKRAFDISFVKPYYADNKRKTKLIRKEVISDHLYSIATYDGWKYHIYRGKCVTILKTEPKKYEDGYVRTRTVPYGDPTYHTNEIKRSKTDQLLERNLAIVIDGSIDMQTDLCIVPVNQIIDIQKYDYIYNFTIYEGNLKVFFEDWFTVRDYKHKEKWFTYVPGDNELPQNLLHEVIEHQKINKEILNDESC